MIIPVLDGNNRTKIIIISFAHIFLILGHDIKFETLYLVFDMLKHKIPQTLKTVQLTKD